MNKIKKLEIENKELKEKNKILLNAVGKSLIIRAICSRYVRTSHIEKSIREDAELMIEVGDKIEKIYDEYKIEK